MRNSSAVFVFGSFWLLFINLILSVNGVPIETQDNQNDKEQLPLERKESEELSPQEMLQSFDANDNLVNVISIANNNNDDDDDENEQDSKNGARKAKVLVDIITRIDGLSSQPIFSLIAAEGLQHAENIEEELVHMGTTIRDLISRKTTSSVNKWRIVNSLIKYFKRSGINDEGIDVPIDGKAIEHELRKLLSILKTQETLRSSAAQKKMDTLFDKYIQETTNAEAHEINSYKGLLYLQMGRFFIQMADILIESFAQSKFAEIFGFLGDFLILKDALVHHTDLHLLHALTRKIESESNDSKIVKNIDLVIKNLMGDHPKLKDGEKWTPKSLETSQMNLYLTIVEHVNQDPNFLKYLKDTDDRI
eukprot:Awhi_evm1s8203